MHDMLPPWPEFVAFLAASFLLAITPGPGVLYIVTRSLAQGRRSGLASVAGVALGNFGNAMGAAIGLGALFAVSSTAFVTIKYVGALYLIYLGVRALRVPRSENVRAMPEDTRLWIIFRDGFLVALLNPKTAMFFAAFLPQFMSAEAASVRQSVTLSTLFVVIAGVTDTAYALAAGAVAPMLMRARGVRSLGRHMTGGVYIGLGLLTALYGSRNVKY